MKVRHQLLLSYVFISLLGVLAGLLGLKAIEDSHQRFDQVINETIPVKNELNDLQKSINDFVLCTNEIIFLKQKQQEERGSNQSFSLAKQRETEIIEQINDWRSDRHDYFTALVKYEKLVLKFFPEEQNYLRDIKKSSYKVIQISKDLIYLPQQHYFSSATILKQQELEQANAKFNHIIETAFRHEDLELNKRKNALYSTFDVYKNGILGFTILSLLLAVAIAFLLSHYILKSLEKLKVTAVAIGQGNLDTRIEMATTNEFGILANTFNQMAEDLQQTTSSLKKVENHNALLAKALEHVADGIEITDGEANYLYVNPAFTKITGYTAPEVMGKTPAVLFRNDRHSRDFYEEIFATVEKGEMWRGLLVSKRKDGTLYDQEVTLSPILDQKGSLINIVAVKRDISDRLQAELALQKSEERLGLVLWGSKDGFWDWNVATNQIFYSTRWKQMRGFAENEIGSDPDECIKRVHPDDANAFTQALQDHLAQKSATFAIEYRSLCKDGSYIWVFDRGQAVWDEAGNPIRMTGSETDITQQKQVEATLCEAERRWRSLLENVQLVVVNLDRFGKVEYINPFFLELTGYNQEEVIGQDWFANFLPQTEKQQVEKCFLELLAQEFHPYYQNAILTKSGQEKAIAWNNTLLHNAQGEIIGTTSIGEDITERKMMERTKDEFISVVSHELRTPLASIQGGLNLISSGLMDPQSDKGRHVMEIVTENTDRLVLLVNDILELERLKLGKVKLLRKTCNAADLLCKASEMMQLLANRSRITLSVSAQPIQVYVDGDRIIQVLTNLISNAIKFAPEGSTAFLTAELPATSNQVLFKVKDQGRGIPADKLDSIFERFQQVDASDSRKKGGTGLGLAICRSIIEQHGGQIWVESVLERGSIFWFTLPYKLEEKQHDNQKSTNC
jgi:PAS domain S-box-containing protein